MKRVAGALGAALLWLVVILCLTITIVPPFLDASYYRGPTSAHFDGQRFFNPDGVDDPMLDAKRQGRGGFLVRYLSGVDARPAWPDRVTLHPVAPPARVAGEAMVATWVGHATVLVQTEGLNILTDPVWSDTVGPFGIGPRRVVEPGIAFAQLPKIDIILVSHDHYDHMDLTTLKRLWDRDRPIIVTSLGNDSVMRQAGVPSRALDWGGATWAGAVQIVVTRNHHWGSRWFADRNRALWSSFVVRLPGGNIFFAGDTGAGDLSWADQAASYGPVRLALIPIGAFRFSAGQMAAGSHIGPIDAAEVYRRLGASRGIGIHWGTFHLSSEAYDTPPKLLAAVTRRAGLRGFGTVPIGRPVAIPAYAPPPHPGPMDREDMMRRLPPAALALP